MWGFLIKNKEKTDPIKLEKHIVVFPRRYVDGCLVYLPNLIFVSTVLSYGGEPVLCVTITVPFKLPLTIVCALDQHTDATFYHCLH